MDRSRRGGQKTGPDQPRSDPKKRVIPVAGLRAARGGVDRSRDDSVVTGLADAVLPLIRTRAELYRWGTSNTHGHQMHQAVDILERAVALYRARLAEIAAGLGPVPSAERRWESPHSHEWFVLDWNAQRLAVLDRDVEAIIRTHARDRRVAAWLHETAKALLEAGEIELAIDWAKRATDFDSGHQARAAGGYWCNLLAAHRPEEVLAARRLVFDRWPSSGTAAALHEAAGTTWPRLREEVMKRLSDSPRDAVLFALLTLRDSTYAWTLAHSVGLSDSDTWTALVTEYQKQDPIAVLPVLANLVHCDLVRTDARNYQIAARRLRTMRKLADGTDKAREVDDLIAVLREEHRRRPRLQLEFDRAGLP